MPRATGLDSDPLEVSLVERGDPGLHRAEGWDIRLAASGRWALTVEAANVDADFRGTTLTRARFAAAGLVRLGDVAPGSEIEVAGGPLRIEIPPGVGVGVVGTAEVPADWTATDDGFASPSGAGGFTIVVVDEVDVTIVEP